MPESEAPKRKTSWVAVAAVMFVAAAVVAALVVVIQNSRRVTPPEPPVAIGNIPADTTLSRFPRTMRRRLRRIENRYEKYRDTVPELTGVQDSLAPLCESGFVRIREALATLDTLQGYQDRAALARDIRKTYNGVRDAVNEFTKAALEAIPEPDLDSLDIELQKLLSE